MFSRTFVIQSSKLIQSEQSCWRKSTYAKAHAKSSSQIFHTSIQKLNDEIGIILQFLTVILKSKKRGSEPIHKILLILENLRWTTLNWTVLMFIQKVIFPVLIESISDSPSKACQSPITSGIFSKLYSR